MMEKPQKLFKDTIDNSTNPFIPKLDHKPNGKYPLDLSKPNEHPYYREIDEESKDISLAQMSPSEFVKPSLEDTAFLFVDTLGQFMELVNKLATENIMALDLETHNERSYQGFTCLMQISIPHFDYVIDTIILREHMHHLGRHFSSPDMIVVLHGDDDTLWLQRDFGLYPRNVFNTRCAARKLGLDQGLPACVHHYFNVTLNKDDQRADWRIKPLPPKMLEYARLDSHYLLPMYALMKNDLIAQSQFNIKPEKFSTLNNLLHDAIAESTHSNLRVYTKKSVPTNPLTDSNFRIGLNEYFKNGRSRDKETDAILVALFRWRDKMARELDEGVSYIMAKQVIFKIAHKKVSTPEEIAKIFHAVPELVEKLDEISDIIKSALTQAREIHTPCQDPIPLSPVTKNKHKITLEPPSLKTSKSRNASISEEIFGVNSQEAANYEALAKEAPKFLQEIYQAWCGKSLDYVVKTEGNQTYVKLMLNEKLLTTLKLKQEREIYGTIEIYAFSKKIAKQNNALLACVTLSSAIGLDPRTSTTSPEFSAYWEKIKKCTYSALVKYMNAKGFMTSQGAVPRSTGEPTTFASKSTKLENFDVNLICKNCEAELSPSEILFAGVGIHSYDISALNNVVLRDHPENDTRPDKLHKLHCKACDHSVGNIMLEDNNKHIYNFKKIDVLFREVDSPHRIMEAYEWIGYKRRNKRSHETEPNKRSQKTNLQDTAGNLQNHPTQSESPKKRTKYEAAGNLQSHPTKGEPPKCETKSETNNTGEKSKETDSYVAEWSVYKLGLDCVPRNYVHLEGRSFSDFLIFTTFQLITKPFAVSKKGRFFSTKCSPMLFQKVNLTESQFQELVQISSDFVQTIPNIKLSARFYVLPFLTPFDDPDFSQYFKYLSSVLQKRPALEVLRDSLCNVHYPSLSLKHVAKFAKGVPQIEEKEIAAKEVMEEIAEKFERRLLITPGLTHRIVTCVDFLKNPNSLNFDKMTFVEYYNKNGMKIKDLDQPILGTCSEPILFSSVFRSGSTSAPDKISSTKLEFIPELTSLSGITVEMYYGGLLLRQALHNLKKSAKELVDLQNFQRTLGFEIRDANLLKKVFTSRSAADSDRQEDLDYEKEEFLGDAVLGLVVSHYLFVKWDSISEGDLSTKRDWLVSNKNLAQVAAQLGFLKHIIVSGQPVVSNQMSDVMEAFIAGLFIESGLEVAAKFISTYIIKDPNFDFFAPPKITRRKVIVPNRQKKEAIDDLQKSIGYSFKSRSLLLQALTHTSVIHDNPEISILSTYERLEFLGDCVFKFIASVHIFSKNYHMAVGQMDRERQGLVSGKVQIKMAKKLGIPKALFLGAAKKLDLEKESEKMETGGSDSEADSENEDLETEEDLDSEEESEFKLEKQEKKEEKKARKKKHPYGDSIEAIVGAVYLETGFERNFSGCCKKDLPKNCGEVSKLLHFLFSLV